ncbi:MAG: poly(3-hydroxybutyrate) depolymerase [Gammaproteobacteria bacterium]|nr:poly(3-hydroxybutyrate) depolymerase [Gammaproteobacteria bacterium]
MKIKKILIGTILGIIGIPATLVLILQAGFYALFYYPNRANGTIVSSGTEREYFLYVPPRHDRSTPTPLVISLHGAGAWPAHQREISQWNSVADEHGFIVVYPSGTTVTGSGGGTGVWPKVWLMQPESVLAKDVRFISDLIDKLTADYNIDPARIYADGLSNGASMAFALSCRLSDRIAAVGAVAAAHMLPWSWCNDPRPVPMIAFHGDADPVIPYNGGTSWTAPNLFPSIPSWTENWARRNGCEPNPIESEIEADVTRREYTGCADNAGVVLYTIRGGGHSWPGGKPMPEWWVGPTSRSIEASRQMWAFFREHRLART